jgi:hypothetical protein
MVVAALPAHGVGSNPLVPARCLTALVAMAEGSVPESSGFTPAPCPAARLSATFHRDNSSGVTRLSRAVAPGDIVPAYPEYGVDMIFPGQTLHLIVVSGATRVERQVEALQPARPGQRLFVRGSEGEIFSVRYRESIP